MDESAARAYVQNQGARTSNVVLLDEALQKPVAGEIDTVIHAEPILRYHVRQSRLEVGVSYSVLVRDDYAFAYPEEGWIRDIFNVVLLLLLFSPEWAKISMLANRAKLYMHTTR